MADKDPIGAIRAGARPLTGGARDYDIEHYVRVLRDSYASRLARAFAPADFEAIFADPEQLPLFPPALDLVRRGEIDDRGPPLLRLERIADALEPHVATPPVVQREPQLAALDNAFGRGRAHVACERLDRA